MLKVCLNATEDQCTCLALECPIVYNHSEELKEACYMENCFISKRALDDVTLYKVTALYIVIFLIGVIGNTTTCLVMKKHPMMKTHASLYLINLAVSDLVTLCVGLPFEVMMNWHQYPWPFPDYVCNLKALIAETTSSVSILTILIFAIERYVAICHPLYLVKTQPFKRNVSSNRTIQPGEMDITEELQMRINVILCAIVSAFFICYLPFQLQRLLFFYLDNEVILTWVNQYVYFISGFLFYLATIINPIAYNLASSRFRRAFKDIIINYCWRGNTNGYPRSSFSKYSLAHTPLRQTTSTRGTNS
uniref:G_PROTEIN_RECEP_F1_2 domain-containing protein n=1 Tax=Caenorhabditis tropicalis TaxID=1561998 RepID=A0A1I7URT5_9PELO